MFLRCILASIHYYFSVAGEILKTVVFCFIDEESSKFKESPLELRSRSSCNLVECRSRSSGSLSISKTRLPQVRNQNEPSILQRRMSDTALSWNEKTIGESLIMM